MESVRKTLQSTVTLNNGVSMPVFGLGVYESGQDTVSAVQSALECGYRLIDTASFYENEREVGEAVRTVGIPRSEIFVTTKIWNDAQREGRQRAVFEESLRALGMEYVDLYLVHWPVPEKIHETWRVLEQLYEEKLVRAIGVSNFLPHHLEKLSVKGNIAPTVDQFECNPYLTRKELRQYCKEHNIIPEAWSPLGRGAALEEPVLKELSEKYNKSVAQIILRYDVQNEIVTIPKSVKKERIHENADVFDFELLLEDIERIDSLNRNLMHGDPDHVDF
ncbi:MAG: aldo/keto reductase [Roseburia sp.]|nr:aldo/keto reductase [Roseburia sp.]